MARVVLVTGGGFRHLWMVDLARRALGGAVAGLLVQADALPNGPAADRRTRLRRGVKRALNRLGLNLPVYMNLTAAERRLWLEHGEPSLDWQHTGIEHLRVDKDPNSPAGLQWLAEVAPDLVVVFGGRILCSPWFETPRLGAMNLHYGLTPDYRGAESVVWAAYQQNWPGLGATVHYLDAGVDTGPVIARVPVAVAAGDNLDTLTARVYWQGMRALVEAAVQSATRDERLPAIPILNGRHRQYPARFCTEPVRRIADRRVRERAALLRLPAEKGMARPSRRCIVGVAQATRRCVVGVARASRLCSSSTACQGSGIPGRTLNGRNGFRHIPEESRQQEVLRSWSRSLADRPATREHLPAGVYILLYHDLSPEPRRPWKDHSQISTEPELFAEHLRYLDRLGRWVTLPEACEHLRRQEVDEPLFVLTFDDGFTSVYQQARRLVAERGIRPMLFLNGAVLAGIHVHYRLLAAILLAEGNGPALVRAARELAPPRVARTIQPRTAIDAWLKQNYSREWTDAAVVAAYRRCHERLPTELFLNSGQLRGLLDDGWQVGNHTWSHARLSRLTQVDLAEELARNEQWLARHFGLDPIHIAYPYGFVPDVGRAARQWVEGDPRRVGLMADGGINLIFDRTGLKRLPLADHDLTDLRRVLHYSILHGQAGLFQMVLAAH